MTGATPRQLDWLIEQGVVSTRRFEYESGRRMVSIAMDDARKVAESVGSWMDLQSAAKRMGLAKCRVRELLEAGLLGASRPTDKGSWLIDKRGLEEMTEICSRHIGGEAKETVSFAVLLKHRRFPRSAFVPLILALRTGQMQVPKQAKPERLVELQLDACSVRDWLVHWCGDSYSIDEAARQLGIKQQVAYQLVRSGLLVASSDRRGLRISIEALRDFQARYVGLAELSRLRGHSPKMMLAELHAQPVCGPRIDGSRQYFFLRKEVVWMGC
ncbi:hypothetical protein GCM10027296_35480 [Chitinimonas naiadis]